MQNCKKQIIAVVDSGIGGVSVLKELIRKYGKGNYIYFADNLNMPYGNKGKQWLELRMDYIINLLKNTYSVDYTIIACNTASSAIAKTKYENVFTMEFQKQKTYFATEQTKKNLPNINVIANIMLAKNIEKYIFDENKLIAIVKNVVKKQNINQLNELVLGCTHYELIKPIFEKFCPNTKIINNSEFLLNNLKLEINSCDELNITIILSQKSINMENKIIKLIKGLN